MSQINKTIEAKIKGKVILVTGGTGSFGNAVVSRLITLNPKKIIIFSRDEKKQHDMRNLYNSQILKFVLGDIREKDTIERAMLGVDFVFHAAALKQVPSCEFFPIEAIKTNVIGAHNVITTAIENRVKTLVILSTDKAVYPINAMGMSKAMMEKVMIADSRKIVEENNSHTTLCGTRYGNVLYTRGSVLPFFLEIMKKNEVLPVTNGAMTRFLLPLSQSVDLVLYAMINGKNGDMYVRKAPATTIEILAKAMCKIFDFKKGYKEVGVRAGEKMHEVLVSEEEMMRAQDQGDYYKIPPESQGLDYQKYYSIGKKIHQIEPFTSANTEQLNFDQTVELLLTLPEIQEELKNWHPTSNVTSNGLDERSSLSGKSIKQRVSMLAEELHKLEQEISRP